MLASRSYEPELLDEDFIPEEAFGQMLKEINSINKWLGGHKITVAGLKKLLPEKITRPITIAEIGCGGGDNLKLIYDYCSSRKIPVSLIGIDIRPECIDYAKRFTTGLPIEYIVSDYKTVNSTEKPDIVFNALFCHHFKEKELVYMLDWMKAYSNIGFFINDLHRHPLAYQSIKWITRMFSKSYMVKYDAPLSVQRGFKKEEWKDLLNKAGIRDYNLEWKWAFRHLLVYKHAISEQGQMLS